MTANTKPTSSLGGLLDRNRIVVALLLFAHVALLSWSAAVHSPAEDEPSHLAAGIFTWKFRRFDLYQVNPPLSRLISALPVVLLGSETDWHQFSDATGARSEFAVGRDFIEANGRRSMWLIMVARGVSIPFSAFGAFICYLWARELYGQTAGLFALTLWCFSPDILGNASLISPDAFGTIFGVAAGYAFWRWSRCPTLISAATAGLALGLAELSKTTWCILFLLWPTIWLIRLVAQPLRSATAWRAGAQLFLSLLVGMDLLNAGYLFSQTGQRLGDFNFVSQSLAGPSGEIVEWGNRFKETKLARFPVPVPKDYLIGIDLQKRDLENAGKKPSYLAEQLQTTGWWYYYLVGLGVKTPLAFLSLLVLTFAVRVLRGPHGWLDEITVIAPPVVVLAFVSSQSAVNNHYRYILPSLPFLFV